MLSDVGDGEAEARGPSRHDARPERCGQGPPRHRLAAHAQAELVAAQPGDSAPLEGSSCARRARAQRQAQRANPNPALTLTQP